MSSQHPACLLCSIHPTITCVKCATLKNFQKLQRGETGDAYFPRPWESSLVKQTTPFLWHHTPPLHTDTLNSKCPSSFFKDLPRAPVLSLPALSFYFVSIF